MLTNTYPLDLAFCISILLSAGALVIEREDFIQVNHDGHVLLDGVKLDDQSGKWSIVSRGEGGITHHILG